MFAGVRDGGGGREWNEQHNFDTSSMGTDPMEVLLDLLTYPMFFI